MIKWNEMKKYNYIYKEHVVDKREPTMGQMDDIIDAARRNVTMSLFNKHNNGKKTISNNCDENIFVMFRSLNFCHSLP